MVEGGEVLLGQIVLAAAARVLQTFAGARTRVRKDHADVPRRSLLRILSTHFCGNSTSLSRYIEVKLAIASFHATLVDRSEFAAEFDDIR